MMDRSTPNMGYQAWRRDPQVASCLYIWFYCIEVLQSSMWFDRANWWTFRFAVLFAYRYIIGEVN